MSRLSNHFYAFTTHERFLLSISDLATVFVDKHFFHSDFHPRAILAHSKRAFTRKGVIYYWVVRYIIGLGDMDKDFGSVWTHLIVNQYKHPYHIISLLVSVTMHCLPISQGLQRYAASRRMQHVSHDNHSSAPSRIRPGHCTSPSKEKKKKSAGPEV
jgi:hypothetical protein